MRRFGKLLMGLGALVGASDVIVIVGHLGLIGVPWIVNVALVKLGLIAAAGLMTAGAATVRLGGAASTRGGDIPRRVLTSPPTPPGRDALESTPRATTEREARDRKPDA
jgi:hypothetical protein